MHRLHRFDPGLPIIEMWFQTHEGWEAELLISRETMTAIVDGPGYVEVGRG
jgi:hypothetical protein